MARKRKNDESLNVWLPIGLLLGVVLGFILFDDNLYIGISTSFGLLLGIVLNEIFGNDEIKLETKKKKRKTRKK